MSELTMTRSSLEKALVENPQLSDDPVIQKALEEQIRLEELKQYLQTIKDQACEQVNLVALKSPNHPS